MGIFRRLKKRTSTSFPKSPFFGRAMELLKSGAPDMIAHFDHFDHFDHF